MISSNYKISDLTEASEGLLMHDVYLVLLNVTRVPPHLAIVINGKIFTLSVKGPTVEGDLRSLLRTIRQRAIETIFIRLTVPPLFTIAQLEEQVKQYMLSYPRVDVGLATCLAPIKDFCGSVYETETRNVNFIYELLPRLEEQKVIDSCYHLNLDKYLTDDVFLLRKYTMEDINDEIRKATLVEIRN
jgi:hypothetical protein